MKVMITITTKFWRNTDTGKNIVLSHLNHNYY